MPCCPHSSILPLGELLSAHNRIKKPSVSTSVLTNFQTKKVKEPVKLTSVSKGSSLFSLANIFP